MTMRVLLVKTSSLGDVIHALPAITDAVNAFPGIKFDWVVEESYAQIPAWHAGVTEVIPVALRRWRKQPISALFKREWQYFCKQLRQHGYDSVIDAQGLIKSALITHKAHGERHGFAYDSAREPFSAWFYNKTYHIDKREHAITRVRQLLAKALGYPQPVTLPDYGIREQFVNKPGFLKFHQCDRPGVVFFHGTTWSTKFWPQRYWLALTEIACQSGFCVFLPWGNSNERDRAVAMAQVAPENVHVLAKGDLAGIAAMLVSARGVIGVDTGLCHLAAALSVPSLTLYSATKPGLTGTYGISQNHLACDFPCSPCLQRKCNFRVSSDVVPACFATLTPDRVWEKFCLLLESTP